LRSGISPCPSSRTMTSTASSSTVIDTTQWVPPLWRTALVMASIAIR
jgi:hypothetical protein